MSKLVSLVITLSIGWAGYTAVKPPPTSPAGRVEQSVRQGSTAVGNRNRQLRDDMRRGLEAERIERLRPVQRPPGALRLLRLLRRLPLRIR